MACEWRTGSMPSGITAWPTRIYSGLIFIVVHASRCPPRPVRCWLALRYILCFSLPRGVVFVSGCMSARFSLRRC